MEFQNLDTFKLKTAAGQWAKDIKKDSEVTISKITLYHYRTNIFLLQRFAEKESDNHHITPLRYAMIFEILCPGEAATEIMSSKNYPLYCPYIAINDFVFRFTSHMAAARVDLPAFAVNDIKEAYKSAIPKKFTAEWVFLPHCTAPGGGGIEMPASMRTDESAVVLYDIARLAIPGQKNIIPEQIKPCSFHALDIPFLRSIASRWGNDYHEKGVLIDRITMHPMGLSIPLKEVLHNPVKDHKYAVVFHCPDCTSDDLSIQDTAAEILDKISGDGFSPYHSLFSATQERGSGSILFYESFENVYLSQPPEDWQKEWRFVLLYSGAVVGCDVWQDTGIELYKAENISRAKENHQTAIPIKDTKNERLPGITSEKNGRKVQDEKDQGTSIDDNMAISLSDKNRKEYLGDQTVIFDSRDEVLERNLWDIHIKPIVDLHFNSASDLQYEYFPEPSCIAQGDLNSIWNNILFHFHTSDYEPEDIKDVMGFLAADMPDTKRNVSIDELKEIFHPLLKGILEDKTLPSFLMFLYHECDVKPCKGTEESCQSNDHVLHATTNLIINQQNVFYTASPTDSNVEPTSEYQAPETLTKDTTSPGVIDPNKWQFRFTGSMWEIDFKGRRYSIIDDMPVRYMIPLIKQPEVPFKYTLLCHLVAGGTISDGPTVTKNFKDAESAEDKSDFVDNLYYQGGKIEMERTDEQIDKMRNNSDRVYQKYRSDMGREEENWKLWKAHVLDAYGLLIMERGGDLIFKKPKHQSSTDMAESYKIAKNRVSQYKRRFFKQLKEKNHTKLYEHFKQYLESTDGSIQYTVPKGKPQWNWEVIE